MLSNLFKYLLKQVSTNNIHYKKNINFCNIKLLNTYQHT